MELITVLAENNRKHHQKEWDVFLNVQKFIIEMYFDWLKLSINSKTKILIGRGVLNIGGKNHSILLSYSPFYPNRYDRIYIDDKSIKYSDEIHLYRDMSLCLYHPKIDKPALQIIPLFKMIPWISEWIVFYVQWKKYGVWLGKEIKHS
ncbi:MAG TPA: hypothetical protein VL125_15810 [Pelobium sp.]|nr:hypothetical protein [Pelobium sp.]